MTHKPQPNIVVIGGGTGSFVVLGALKRLTPNLTAIVSMSDDGGSTGVLRDELGVLPPGDARQCLVALSESPELRNMFNYRFGTGSLAGQSLGNIILSGLELQHGSFEEAVAVASRLLRIRGTVVPVALGEHSLVMRDGDQEITGQHKIDLHEIVSKDPTVRLEPGLRINPAADQAIRSADLVIFAPGSLYTSLLPNCSVSGIAEALAETHARVVMVANLVNKATHTKDWHIVDFVKVIESYVGEGTIDMVLYNTKPISASLLEKYAEAGDFPVATTDDRFHEVTASFRPARLVSSTLAVQDSADKAIRRTLIRHDGFRLATEIQALLGGVE